MRALVQAIYDRTGKNTYGKPLGRLGVIAARAGELGPLLEWIRAYPDPTAGPPVLVQHLELEVNAPVAERPAPTWIADPDCVHCGGHGLTEVTPGNYGPCPCRRNPGTVSLVRDDADYVAAGGPA